MVVDEHGVRTFKMVVVDVFVPHKCTSFIIFGDVVCPNILNAKCMAGLAMGVITLSSPW
jgi:hypothetical protein